MQQNLHQIHQIKMELKKSKSDCFEKWFLKVIQKGSGQRKIASEAAQLLSLEVDRARERRFRELAIERDVLDEAELDYISSISRSDADSIEDKRQAVGKKIKENDELILAWRIADLYKFCGLKQGTAGLKDLASYGIDSDYLRGPLLSLAHHHLLDAACQLSAFRKEFALTPHFKIFLANKLIEANPVLALELVDEMENDRVAMPAIKIAQARIHRTLSNYAAAASYAEQALNLGDSPGTTLNVAKLVRDIAEDVSQSSNGKLRHLPSSKIASLDKDEIRSRFLRDDVEFLTQAMLSSLQDGEFEFYSLRFLLAYHVERDDAEEALKVILQVLDAGVLEIYDAHRTRHLISGISGGQECLDCIDQFISTYPIQMDDDVSILNGLSLATESETLEKAIRAALFYLQGDFMAIKVRLALSDQLSRAKDLGVDNGLVEQAAQEAARVERLPDPRPNVALLESLEAFCKDIYDAAIPSEPAPKVSLLCPLHREDDLENLKSNILRQNYSNLETIIIANGELENNLAVDRFFSDIPHTKVLHSSEKRIGKILNFGLQSTSGEFVARFDGDDVYFDNYISRRIGLLVATGYDIGAQNCYFMYLERYASYFIVNLGPFLRDYKECRSYGSGASLVCRREVFEKVPFRENVLRGEDYLFFEDAIDHGFGVYNFAPFGMVVHRNADKSKHTWLIDDLSIFGGNLDLIGSSQIVNRLDV